ncbi:C2H2 type zinc finger domain protein [Penicillium angulare]|uniref:C2H2 type zinc finger domain protein n=1 Tax=Penicillium angulare TaxID=116970 RepID=UPI00254072DA|nr:C2H2 type zinc finger domain protein [Penicillium angulare]KAJ5291177.1 C2H2 type zinc finger domain protein [Penicillium angulare]
MNTISGLPTPMPFEFTVYDDESLDRFYMSPSAFPSTCDISYESPDVSNMNSFFIPDCGLPSIEDPGLLAIPTIPEHALFNDTMNDADSVFSWSTFSTVTESPRPSPRDPSSSPGSQKERDDLLNYGVPSDNGSWRCAFVGCSSKTTFQRGCDLRKHYKRHDRHFFCRHPECPKSLSGGFSSKKDRGRHEAKHNPTITCEWDGCERVFSRMDNMRDHLRRVHHKRTRSR